MGHGVTAHRALELLEGEPQRRLPDLRRPKNQVAHHVAKTDVRAREGVREVVRRRVVLRVVCQLLGRRRGAEEVHQGADDVILRGSKLTIGHFFETLLCDWCVGW